MQECTDRNREVILPPDVPWVKWYLNTGVNFDTYSFRMLKKKIIRDDT